MSAAFWRYRLHADPGALGSTLRISGRPWTVVGVLAEGFKFLEGTEAPTVFLPFGSNGKGSLFESNGEGLVRMKPGVSLSQAQAEAQSIFAHTVLGAKQTIEMASYSRYLTGDTSSALWALLGGCAVCS